MATATKTYDVFISHSVSDRDVARLVAQSLEAAGLATFHLGAVEVGTNVSEAIWQALAESHAVVAIISPDLTANANIMLEIGAATAWNKPVYVVVTEPESTRLTGILQNYPIYPLNRLDDVTRAIQAGFQPLTESDFEILAEVYQQVGISTDQLSQSPESLREIASRFRALTDKNLPGERLLYELFRMRKRGRLPRLRR